MWYEEIFSLFYKSFNEKQCYDYVEKIYSNDRWFDFSHFKKTAYYCYEEMKKIGLKDVELLPLKADGRTAYGDWVIPRAWDAEKATLRIVDSESILLADYEKTPCSLMMYSAPTPPEGIRAEVMLVDEPDSISLGDVKGKIIFTSDHPNKVINLAIQGGALGIISDFIPTFGKARRSREDVYEASRWENGFIVPLNDTQLFGFSLSPRMGNMLREKIMEEGSRNRAVKLEALVDTKFYDGTVYTVSGMIPGAHQEEEEVLVCGHLYEPGANDNATGCGTILELAGLIIEGIEYGQLSPPDRNIRFVMGFESMGIMGYYTKHSERMEKTVAAINMDMVGANAIDKAKMHLWHNPMSNWSYTDTLIYRLNQAYQTVIGDKFEFVNSPFEIGDNLLADPMIDVPTVSMVMHPAESYHSSLDTMERVDPKVLKRNGVICGAFIFFLAWPEDSRVLWLLNELTLHCQELMKENTDDQGYAYLLGEAFYEACLALKDLIAKEDLKITTIIEDTAKRLPRSSKPEGIIDVDDLISSTARKIIPVRNVKGCISFHTMLRTIRETIGYAPFYSYNLNCPLFWTDGKRNLFEIAELAAIELRKENKEEYLMQLIDFFEKLERYEYINCLSVYHQ